MPYKPHQVLAGLSTKTLNVTEKKTINTFKMILRRKYLKPVLLLHLREKMYTDTVTASSNVRPGLGV